MNKEEIILATLASGNDNNTFYSPVKIQKLFFLIDKNLAEKFGGALFNFEPYHYGPFDREVYNEFAKLKIKDKVETTISPQENFNKYKLTNKGFEEGKILLEKLSPDVKDYITNLNSFVLSLSFTELVGAIYKEYPEMKVNSIFNK
jgi:hypothetical protein